MRYKKKVTWKSISQHIQYCKHYFVTCISLMSNCCICGAYFSGLLCRECFLKLSVRTGFFCLICGALVKNKNNICKHCRDQNRNKHMPYIYSLWHYTAELKHIFLLYKKQGIHIFGQYFARQILPLFDFITKPLDTHTQVYIVSVPPHPKNKRKLGFDCIALMASYVASYTKARYLKRVFIRKKSAIQKELSAAERKNNMQSALKVNMFIKKHMQVTGDSSLKGNNKVIILLDDVVTTGATMQACYEKIRAIYPDILIYGVSVCRVDYI